MLYSKKNYFLITFIVLLGCTNQLVKNNNQGINKKSANIISPFKKSQQKVVVRSKPVESRASFYKNKLVYLKMNNHSTVNSDLYEDKLMKYLIDQQLFRKVITRSPTLYINVKSDEIKKIHHKYWFDRTDPLNIEQIYRYFLKNKEGLVLETSLQGDMPNRNRYSLINKLSFWAKLIDVKNGQVLFYARSTSNSSKLQRLYSPVFNKLQRWLR